ncbi:hypothetical protein AWENTII_002910 [Aspergillus wentii]
MGYNGMDFVGGVGGSLLSLQKFQATTDHLGHMRGTRSRSWGIARRLFLNVHNFLSSCFLLGILVCFFFSFLAQNKKLVFSFSSGTDAYTVHCFQQLSCT